MSRHRGPTHIAVERLAIIAAERGLAGPGFGPVERTIGWPADVIEDRAGGLGRLSEYLPAWIHGQISAGQTVPPSVAFHLLQMGAVSIRKHGVGADPSGRPGRYLLRAIADPTRRLDGRAAMAWWDGAPLERFYPWEPELTADQPRAAVSLEPFAPAQQPVEKHLLTSVLAAVLAYLDGTGPLVGLWVDDPQDAAGVIRAVLWSLPRTLAAGLTFSTFEADPDQSPVGLCAAVRSLSRVASSARSWIVSGPGQPSAAPIAARWMETARHLSDRYQRALPSPPDAISSSADLARWVTETRVLDADPRTLSPSDIETILESSAGRAWLLRDGHLQAAFTAGVSSAAHAGRIGNLIRSVFSDDKETLLKAARQLTVWTAEKVVLSPGQDHPDALPRRLLDFFGVPSRVVDVEVAEQANRWFRSTASSPDAFRQAAPLARFVMGFPPTQPDPRWLEIAEVRGAAQRTWSLWTQIVLTEFITSAGQRWPTEATACVRTFPDHWRSLLAHTVAECGIDVIVRALRRLPDSDFDPAIGVLIQSSPTDALQLLRELEKPDVPAPLRDAVVKHWSALFARRLGLPPSITVWPVSSTIAQARPADAARIPR